MWPLSMIANSTASTLPYLKSSSLAAKPGLCCMTTNATRSGRAMCTSMPSTNVPCPRSAAANSAYSGLPLTSVRSNSVRACCRYAALGYPYFAHNAPSVFNKHDFPRLWVTPCSSSHRIRLPTSITSIDHGKCLTDTCPVRVHSPGSSGLSAVSFALVLHRIVASGSPSVIESSEFSPTLASSLSLVIRSAAWPSRST